METSTAYYYKYGNNTTYIVKYEKKGARKNYSSRKFTTQ